MIQTVTLPPLPYAYEALEPYMDAETLHIHHDKHHQAYVDKYNLIINSNSEISDKTLCELLSNTEDIPVSIRQNLLNQGGGVYNHNFFWQILSPTSTKEPIGNLKVAIDKDFGNFETFKSEFSTAASLNFGSGWTWLVNGPDGKLEILNTANQDTPISQGLTPILTLDVWEHAYYLKYKNLRPEYIKAFWNIVNWEQAEKLYNGEAAPTC